MIQEPIEREAVQLQLERMLASPLFRNSKRYPGFLRFVVEQSLNPDHEPLKERVLGVRVFGREPDYDTNEDPVVRVTAGEVRKRIAQYYHEPGRENELRIDLPPGSYIAEFHRQSSHFAEEARTGGEASASAGGLALETASVAPPASPGPPVVIRPTNLRPKRGRGRLMLALTSAAAGCALAATVAVLMWPKPVPRTVVDRFWAPLLEQNARVILCVGQRNFVAPVDDATRRFFKTPLTPGSEEPKPGSDVALAQLYYLGSQNVAVTDSIAMARVVSLLQSKGNRVQIRGERSINLGDLRDQPSVLIGAFSNDWSLLLTGPLRFSFRVEGSRFELVDSQHPDDHRRSLNFADSYRLVEQDYALVTRERDTNTGRVMLVFGGIGGFGTQAAGEFLTDPAYMAEFLAGAPPDWERKNLQIVLGTKIIKGASGPPFVIASHYW